MNQQPEKSVVIKPVETKSTPSSVEGPKIYSSQNEIDNLSNKIKYQKLEPSPVEVTNELFEELCLGDSKSVKIDYRGLELFREGTVEKARKYLNRSVHLPIDDKSDPIDYKDIFKK